MWRRWAWVAVAVAIVGVGVVPFALDRDSFPLSTFPMFAADIDRTQSVDTAVAVDADGGVIRLTPAEIGGTTVVNQAASVVTTAIVGGRAADLCTTIAGRLGGPTKAGGAPRPVPGRAGGGRSRDRALRRRPVVRRRPHARRARRPRPLPGGARDPHRGACRPGAERAPPAGSSPPPPPPGWRRCAS